MWTYRRKNYYTIGLIVKKKSASKRSSSIYASNTVSEFLKIDWFQAKTWQKKKKFV